MHGEPEDNGENNHRRRAMRYVDLPPRTREWLDNLRPRDIQDYEDAIRLFRSSQTLGRFWKWVLLAIVSVFALTVQFGESVVKIFAWFRR